MLLVSTDFFLLCKVINMQGFNFCPPDYVCMCVCICVSVYVCVCVCVVACSTMVMFLLQFGSLLDAPQLLIDNIQH